jgi:hypothetical protein
MTTDAPGATRKPAVSAPFCETIAASLLLLWRIWILPVGNLCRDTVAIVALYWLIIRFAAATRLARAATFLVMAGLLVLYAWGQAPASWAVVRNLP